MKIYAKCERCSRYGDANHHGLDGTAWAQMQAIQQFRPACSIAPPQMWHIIEGKAFCQECSTVIQDALNAAMAPPPVAP